MPEIDCVAADYLASCLGARVGFRGGFGLLGVPVIGMHGCGAGRGIGP